MPKYHLKRLSLKRAGFVSCVARAFLRKLTTTSLIPDKITKLLLFFFWQGEVYSMIDRDKTPKRAPMLSGY